MTLEDLIEHAESLRALLEAHSRHLPKEGTYAVHARHVVDALIPRVEELERQCAELAEQRTASLSAVS